MHVGSNLPPKDYLRKEDKSLLPKCPLFGGSTVMKFIDHFNGLRQAFGTQVFKKTCTLAVCGVPLLRSSPSLGRSCIRISVVSQYCQKGLSRCACPTKSGPRGVNTMGEQHPRMWHVPNMYYSWGKNPGHKGIINQLMDLGNRN